jgi:hypothetical protein
MMGLEPGPVTPEAAARCEAYRTGPSTPGSVSAAQGRAGAGCSGWRASWRDEVMGPWVCFHERLQFTCGGGGGSGMSSRSGRIG